MITESPLKMMKNTFYVTLKARSQDIYVFVMTFVEKTARKNGHVEKTARLER